MTAATVLTPGIAALMLFGVFFSLLAKINAIK